MAFPKKARFVVIGAGIHGLSTAWHLSEKLKKKNTTQSTQAKKLNPPRMSSVKAFLWNGVWTQDDDDLHEDMDADDWEGVIVESDIDKIQEVFDSCIFWEIKTTNPQEDRYIVCYNN